MTLDCTLKGVERTEEFVLAEAENYIVVRQLSWA
jgi:hypothetical protein